MTASLDGYDVLLLDIEGTTTPVSFVYNVLFPFARAHAQAYLADHWETPAIQEDLALFRQQAEEDAKQDIPQAKAFSAATSQAEQKDALWAYIQQMMDGDRKVTALKSLQGKIWAEGYASGALQSELFPDVSDAFIRWKAAGHTVAIYSSGSIAAQKLLFAHTPAGDLTPYIQGNFDTTSGHKREVTSYQNIAKQLQCDPSRVLFLTDIYQEAQAAHDAGMKTAVMLRPGNAPQPEHPFPTLPDFRSLL
ncbi:MAG: acireductone synthase [Myxococcales bacterium]|nr:acireductone synthase [Myxococcales bacterium]MCB9644366.1 acireductone synthase [Myxococcales bacterium]